MENRDIATILEEVRSNPDVAKELKEQGPVETPEEIAAVWAKAAAGLGYDLAPEDILSYIRDAEAEMRRKAEENKDEIENLSPQELEEAAGGKAPYEKCQVSYKDRENCWVADGCDNVAVVYPGYLCHKFFKDTCKKFMG